MKGRPRKSPLLDRCLELLRQKINYLDDLTERLYEISCESNSKLFLYSRNNTIKLISRLRARGFKIESNDNFYILLESDDQ